MRAHIRGRLDDAVLWIYRGLRHAEFPICLTNIIGCVPRCRYITYDDLARISGVGYRDIVRVCKSVDGCTQYDPLTDCYLIIINTSKLRAASPARVRWTTAHELGHVLAGHFHEIMDLREADISPSNFDEMEEEADYFAASVLAPIPAMELLRVKRPADIRDWFGLSQTAAEYRWSDFQRDCGDPRLADHFSLFFPRSDIKYMQLLHPRNIDIVADPCEEPSV